MRATATLLTVSLAWGLMSTASPPLAASDWVANSAAVVSCSVGQSESSGASDRRLEADRRLAEARKAMQEGKLDVAERWIEQAENLGADYNVAFARFQDTPEKARRDLAQLRSQKQALLPAPDTRSSASQSVGARADQYLSRFSPGPADAAPAAASPGQPTRVPMPPDVDRLSSYGSAQPAAPAAGGEQPARAESRALLLNARRALAQRNVQHATDLAAQAKRLGIAYALHEDSPAKVDSLIQKASRLLQTAGPAAGQPEQQREYARLLLEQADGLLQYEDFDQAERLALEAQNLSAEFPGFERTPAQLLRQIRSQREAAAGGPARQPGSFRLSSRSNPAGQSPTANLGAVGTGGSKEEALRLVALARMALDRGDPAAAERLAQQAQQLNVPDSAFSAEETRPWQVLLEVNRVLNRRASAVVQAGGPNSLFAAGEAAGQRGRPVAHSLYLESNDKTRNVLAAAQAPTQPADAPPEAGPADSPAMRQFQDGMRALEQHDRETARRHFEQAWRQQDQLDPLSRQKLKDKLTLLNTGASEPSQVDHGPSPLTEVDAKQQLLYQKLQREIISEQAEARKASARDPLGALEKLRGLRDRVGEAELDAAARKQLLTMVDRNISELQQYVDANRSQIQLDQRNAAIRESIELDRQKTIEVQNKIAELVEKFNTLVDDQRYSEAEVVAKQARELDPESPVVLNLIEKSRFLRRIKEQLALEEGKERGFYDATTAVLASSTPFDDRKPLVMPDAQYWEQLTDSRFKALARQRSRLTPAEMEIQKALKTQVEVRFSERPLAEVMEALGTMAGVNIFLDPQGLAAEGVTTDTPVTINLTQPISLQSALNLILEPLRLSYVLQNEVLRVTSEQTRDSDTYARVYNVADLVIPIPNFIPGYHIGLPAAIREAHNALGYGALNRPAGVGPLTIAANEGAAGAVNNRSVLAEMGLGSGSLSPNSTGTRPPRQMGYGPGGLGDGAAADFDTLINLIVSTVAPESWDEVGGPGSIESFPTNLSLVISQTQEVHDQIVDLLDQLRRLQDLQVTIEVRFITLNDRFFERIGVDFNFDIVSHADRNTLQNKIDTGEGPSATVGYLPTKAITSNLNIPFRQGSFGSTIPQFGPFDAASAANFGFAILSDIEVYFLLQAAEGDTRTNVLQAPKVTLFNGQMASVYDQSQRPFVTSIIPVVGDFAAAHQPVIVVLSEGTSLSVQAVVSSDRRFVRLTLVPFFSQIGKVETFTFTGKTTTDTGSNVVDKEGNPTGYVNDAQNVHEGTTVQLPTFVFTTVNTTVSVPDGGTVLMGGIKRLSEGRNERGVPMLSKIPYINRLFKNVGIGRETESLMMMVTPRIIIQEEEELAQTGLDSSAL